MNIPVFFAVVLVVAVFVECVFASSNENFLIHTSVTTRVEGSKRQFNKEKLELLKKWIGLESATDGPSDDPLTSLMDGPSEIEKQELTNLIEDLLAELPYYGKETSGKPINNLIARRKTDITAPVAVQPKHLDSAVMPLVGNQLQTAVQSLLNLDAILIGGEDSDGKKPPVPAVAVNFTTLEGETDLPASFRMYAMKSAIEGGVSDGRPSMLVIEPVYFDESSSQKKAMEEFWTSMHPAAQRKAARSIHLDEDSSGGFSEMSAEDLKELAQAQPMYGAIIGAVSGLLGAFTLLRDEQNIYGGGGVHDFFSL